MNKANLNNMDMRRNVPCTISGTPVLSRVKSLYENNYIETDDNLENIKKEGSTEGIKNENCELENISVQLTNGSKPKEIKDARNTPLEAKYPDGGWGWVVVFGSWLVYVVIGALGSSYGLLYIAIHQETGFAISQLSWIGATTTGMMCLSGPIIGPLTRSVTCRTLTVIGGIIGSVGCACAYFSLSLPMLYILFGICPGIGLALGFTPSNLIVEQYFRKKTALSFGLITSGAGFGMVAAPPVASVLLENVHVKQMFLIISGFFGSLLVLAGLTYRPRPCNSKKGRLQSLREVINEFIAKDVLMSPKFILFWIANFSICLAFGSNLTFLPIKAKSSGLSLELSAWVVTLYGLSDTVGRVTFAQISQKCRNFRIHIYLVAVCFTAGFYSFVIFSTTFEMMSIAACGIGISMGPWVVMPATILGDIFGHEKLPNSLGVVFVALGAGNLIGPPAGGFLSDLLGESNGAFFFCLGCQVLAVCSVLSLLILMRKHNMSDLSTVEVSITVSQKKQQMAYIVTKDMESGITAQIA